MTELEPLLETASEDRGEEWERAFLGVIPDSRVRVLNPEPEQGPDGWPYLMVSTDAVNAQESEPLRSVLNWLATRGIGLVINPRQAAPDFVLSYGMIWNFKERGEFVCKAPPLNAGPIEMTADQEVLAGAPSEAFLPTYARSILKQFLLDQGVFAPKFLMVSFDKIHYDLCFSVESLKSPPQSEHAGIAEALAWFLPAHYAISLVSEKTIPGFVLL